MMLSESIWWSRLRSSWWLDLQERRAELLSRLRHHVPPPPAPVVLLEGRDSSGNTRGLEESLAGSSGAQCYRCTVPVVQRVCVAGHFEDRLRTSEHRCQVPVRCCLWSSTAPR